MHYLHKQGHHPEMPFVNLSKRLNCMRVDRKLHRWLLHLRNVLPVTRTVLTRAVTLKPATPTSWKKLLCVWGVTLQCRHTITAHMLPKLAHSLFWHMPCQLWGSRLHYSCHILHAYQGNFSQSLKKGFVSKLNSMLHCEVSEVTTELRTTAQTLSCVLDNVRALCFVPIG